MLTSLSTNASRVDALRGGGPAEGASSAKPDAAQNASAPSGGASGAPSETTRPTPPANSIDFLDAQIQRYRSEAQRSASASDAQSATAPETAQPLSAPSTEAARASGAEIEQEKVQLPDPEKLAARRESDLVEAERAQADAKASLERTEKDLQAAAQAAEEEAASAASEVLMRKEMRANLAEVEMRVQKARTALSSSALSDFSPPPPLGDAPEIDPP